MIGARQFLPLLGVSLGFVARGEAAAFLSRPSNGKSVRLVESLTPTVRTFAVDSSAKSSEVVDEEQRVFNQAWSEARRRQRSVDHPEEAFTTASDQIPSLATLPMVTLSDVNVSAIVVPDHVTFSAFAIYNDDEDLQYVGASRDLKRTLRALRARLPDRARFAKMHHVERKGRTYLDLVVDWWLAEATAEEREERGGGGPPPGNEGGDDAELWRDALDVSGMEDENYDEPLLP